MQSSLPTGEPRAVPLQAAPSWCGVTPARAEQHCIAGHHIYSLKHESRQIWMLTSLLLAFTFPGCCWSQLVPLIPHAASHLVQGPEELLHPTTNKNLTLSAIWLDKKGACSSLSSFFCPLLNKSKAQALRVRIPSTVPAALSPFLKTFTHCFAFLC